MARALQLIITIMIVSLIILMVIVCKLHSLALDASCANH